MDPPLCSRGLPPHTRFALPATRERHLSIPEIGENERDYLFKELHKLKSNNLMSSLRSQNPLEYPQMYTVLPSPSDQSGVPYLRKRSRSPWFFSAQLAWSQKDPQWLPRLGLNPSANLPLPPFLTPPIIGHSCQPSHIFPALLGCHSKSGQVWLCGA